MGRQQVRAIWMALLVAAVCAVPAGAQVTGVSADTSRISSRLWGIGPVIGYYRSSGSDAGALYVGAAARLRLGNVLALEATLGYRGKQDFVFGKVNGSDLSAKLHAIPVTVSMLLFIAQQGGFIPYLLAGAGMHVVSVDYSNDLNRIIGDETKAKFGFHLGLGAEAPLTSYLSVYADYRYSFLGDIFTSNAQYDFSQKNYGGHGLNAGLLVYF